MAVSLDSCAADAPAVIGCDVDLGEQAPRLIEVVLDQLSVAVCQLYPAWLPGGEYASGVGGFERRTVRALARSLAQTSAHYGPFLESVAEDALTGRSTSAAFPPETRAIGVRRILSTAYQREAVVVMLSSRATGPDAGGVGAAAAWLADHGDFGVWLVGAELAGVDRFPALTPDLPDYVARLEKVAPAESPVPDYPAVAGRPHPRSAAEQLLEARLSTLAWARDRVWNQVHQSHPLAPPIRVDLVFPGTRCAVEIDGPDHRGALKYADDRRRDNSLVLDGYAVLRFTNDEVHDDVARVLGTIERLLIDRTPQKGDTP